MGKLQTALDLAKAGYHVFPLEVNSKLPHIDAFPDRASRDSDTIRAWWTDPLLGTEQPWNIGISTSHYGDNKALLVIDVDNKDGTNGDDSLIALQIDEGQLPDTALAHTPTGGRHHIYLVDEAIQQGAAVLGPGIDTRSRGGYIVAAGSDVPAGSYRWGSNVRTPVWAPEWLVSRLGRAVSEAPRSTDSSGISIAPHVAADRAKSYLAGLDDAVQGERNHKGYVVAARLKDIGVEEPACYDLMAEHWKCSPPLDPQELEHVIRSAYKYGRSAPGSASPEAQFDPLSAPSSGVAPESGDHPFGKLNSEFAFVIAGGGSHILWETRDAHDRAKLEHLNLTAFHQKFASWTMQLGEKNRPVTELWMKDKDRRSYDGLCFRPGLTTPPRFYNLWRGFAVQPVPLSTNNEQHKSVDMLLEHCFENVCGSNENLYRWLIGFFAHMIQKPWEKPQVALVFRGGKGVGKSATVERIGHLLGNHFLSTSNRRYLVGNFNGHLENCLFFVLEEAFWSGDKQAEGVLKDLITGNNHVIEHKGKETFTVDNLTRIGIVGNEDWLVPASHDERRYAVFDVGDARKQDRDYFYTMRRGMERGGYGALLHYLQHYSLVGLDFNEAPATKALQDQKEESLDPVLQWWLECLAEGRIVGSDLESAWPDMIGTARFRAAYQRYAKERNVRSWMPDSKRIGRLLKKCLPEWDGRKRIRHGDAMESVYYLPPLADCRKAWDNFIGHEENWDA